MDWIEDEAFGLGCPLLADKFVGREPFEGLQSAAEIISRDEVVEMLFQLVMVVVMIALDSCFFDGAVHALNLTIGPGMLGLCEPVIDVGFRAGEFEGVGPDKLASGKAFFKLLSH